MGLAAAFVGCGAPDMPAATTVAPAAVTSRCGAQGRLSTSLYGAIAGPVNWTAADLDCDGMPRPNGEGARLRFAGSEGEQQIAIIIAMPGLEQGATDSEIASNVTLIEEGSGRFFSTVDHDNCWTDITSLEATDDSGERFSIGGILYCVAPLAEVNGDSSISIPELEFQGLLDWNAS